MFSDSLSLQGARGTLLHIRVLVLPSVNPIRAQTIYNSGVCNTPKAKGPTEGHLSFLQSARELPACEGSGLDTSVAMFAASISWL